MQTGNGWRGGGTTKMRAHIVVACPRRVQDMCGLCCVCWGSGAWWRAGGQRTGGGQEGGGKGGRRVDTRAGLDYIPSDCDTRPVDGHGICL